MSILLSLSFLATLSAATADSIKTVDSVEYTLPSAIVVVGTRTTENWLDLPAASTIMTDAARSSRRGVGLDELARQVPGLLGQSRSGGTDIRVTVRGFGARGAGERSNAGTTRGVRFLLDGFPLTEPDGRTALDLVDPALVSQMEVMRSNGSVIWGNASGGVISLSTHPAILSPFTELTGLTGAYGLRKSVIRTGVPTDGGSIYAAMSLTDFDGWRAHSSGSRTLASLSWRTTPDSLSELDLYLVGGRSRYRIPGPLTPSEVKANPRQAQDDPGNYSPSYVQRDERRDNKTGRVGLRYARQLGDGFDLTTTAFLSPKVLQRSERNTFRDFTRYHLGGSANLSRRLLSREKRARMVAGIDEAYQDGAILFYSLVNGQRGDEIRSDKREGANNLGLFGQIDLAFSERWDLLAGLRWESARYYYDDHISPELNSRRTFSKLLPRLGLSFGPIPDARLYAAWSSGVEIPAGNETDPPSTFGEDTITAINPQLEPIQSWTIETGFKRQALRVSETAWHLPRLDLAVFHTVISDDIIPYRGGRFYFTAGKTKRTGVEGSVELQYRSRLHLFGSGTFMHSRYDTYVVDSVHYGQPGARADFSGNRVAGLPRYHYYVGLNCELPPWKQLAVDLALRGTGRYFSDDANQFVVDNYSIVDLALELDGVNLDQTGLKLSARLGVQNVTYQEYAASAYINPDLNQARTEPIYLEPGLPRNWVLSVSLSHEW